VSEGYPEKEHVEDEETLRGGRAHADAGGGGDRQEVLEK